MRLKIISIFDRKNNEYVEKERVVSINIQDNSISVLDRMNSNSGYDLCLCDIDMYLDYDN